MKNKYKLQSQGSGFLSSYTNIQKEQKEKFLEKKNNFNLMREIIKFTLTSRGKKKKKLQSVTDLQWVTIFVIVSHWLNIMCSWTNQLHIMLSYIASQLVIRSLFSILAKLHYISRQNSFDQNYCEITDVWKHVSDFKVKTTGPSATSAAITMATVSHSITI